MVRPSSRPYRTFALVSGLYVLFSLLATYPVALRPFDRVNGFSKDGTVPAATPPLSIWSMGVVVHQLGRHPLHLFDGNAFYPYGDTLAFSEHLFVPALLGAPVLLLSRNPVFAYNAVVLLTLVLAASGTYLLVLEITAEPLAAFGAGLLYAFHTWNVNELQRLQILSNEFFPFVMWTLLRYFARPTWGRASAVAFTYLLQSLSCMYWALYLPLLCGVLFLFLEWRHRLAWSRLIPLVGAMGLALLFILPFALPYVRTASGLGFERPVPDSLLLNRYLEVLPGSVLYRHVLGTALPNQNAGHFLGFAALVLGMIGFFSPTPSARLLRPILGVLVVGGFLLSLGPTIMVSGRTLFPGPYLLLRDFVPGFRNVRYPERLSLVLMLGLAPLVGVGLARVRPRLGGIGTTALCLFLFLEHLALPQPLSTLPSRGEVPGVYSFLKADPRVHVVAEVPSSRCWMERADALPMYFSTFHWKRIVEGYTSYFPPTYNFMKWRLFHFPDPASVRFLERFGVDTIVVDPSTDGRPPAWVSGDPRWEVAGSFPEGHVVLRLKNVSLNPFLALDPEPRLLEVPRGGWQVKASGPGAEAAVDGDPHTGWISGGDQRRGEFFQVKLPAPVTVSRISMDVHSFLTQTEEFPTHLVILGRLGSEPWREIPTDAEAAYDRFFSRLLHTPRTAVLDFEIPPTELTGLQLRIKEDDGFGMPWTLTELHLFGPP